MNIIIRKRGKTLNKTVVQRAVEKTALLFQILISLESKKNTTVYTYQSFNEDLQMCYVRYSTFCSKHIERENNKYETVVNLLFQLLVKQSLRPLIVEKINISLEASKLIKEMNLSKSLKPEVIYRIIYNV